MNLLLRVLTLEDKEAFTEGMHLFSDMDRDWYTFVFEDGMTYEEHLRILDDNFHGRNIPKNRVPDTMLYAFLDGKIVGRSSIRHELNEYLLNVGGNIGYSVATAYRKRGIANEILRQSLVFCKDVLKLEKVLISCDDANVGSYKVIEKNGGILENKVFNQDTQNYSRRYWVNLT